MKKKLNMDPPKKSAISSRYYGPMKDENAIWSAIRDCVDVLGHLCSNLELLRKNIRLVLIIIQSI